MNLTVKDTIYKPLEAVFNAIVSSEKLCYYFTSYASEDIREGKLIIWRWADYDVSAEVAITTVEKDEQISFEWVVSGKKSSVAIRLNKEEDHKTSIEITEHKFGSSEKEIERMMGQTQGWTDFICSLKAYLYTGINLRTGNLN